MSQIIHPYGVVSSIESLSSWSLCCCTWFPFPDSSPSCFIPAQGFRPDLLPSVSHHCRSWDARGKPDTRGPHPYGAQVMEEDTGRQSTNNYKLSWVHWNKRPWCWPGSLSTKHAVKPGGLPIPCLGWKPSLPMTATARTAVREERILRLWFISYLGT